MIAHAMQFSIAVRIHKNSREYHEADFFYFDGRAAESANFSCDYESSSQIPISKVATLTPSSTPDFWNKRLQLRLRLQRALGARASEIIRLSVCWITTSIVIEKMTTDSQGCKVGKCFPRPGMWKRLFRPQITLPLPLPTYRFRFH